MESKKRLFVENAHTFNGEKIEEIANSLGISVKTLRRYTSQYGHGRLSIKDGFFNVHKDWGELRTYYIDDDPLKLISSVEERRESEDDMVLRVINKEGIMSCERMG